MNAGRAHASRVPNASGSVVDNLLSMAGTRRVRGPHGYAPWAPVAAGWWR